MFGQAISVSNAYRTAGVEAEVLGSDPHHLILLLFEGAISRIRDARRHMLAGNIQAKSEAIIHASDIIMQGLRASLDLKHGGNLAQSLDDLYEYIDMSLLKAHAKNDTAPLDEALQLLGELSDAWAQIAPQVRNGE